MLAFVSALTYTEETLQVSCLIHMQLGTTHSIDLLQKKLIIILSAHVTWEYLQEYVTLLNVNKRRTVPSILCNAHKSSGFIY
jgi:hypothetical protein